MSFIAYWEKNYETNVCEFVVEFNEVEVYRKGCYEGPTCRDSSDSASVTVDYEHGTLRWIKQEYRPLEYRVDPETGCTIWYCGDCECTCKELCATIYEEDGSVFAKGTLPDTAYECEPPLWAGVVGEYEVSLSLGYDSYNRCVIAPTVNGIDRQAVLASGCKQLSATIELDQYRTLSVVCKECDCDLISNVICCPDRTCPDDSLPNALPTSLTVQLTASFPLPAVITPATGHSFEAPPPSACFDFEFDVFLIECRGESNAVTYAGVGENNCTWCGNNYTVRISVVLTCAGEGTESGGWILTVEAVTPPGSCELPGDVYRVNFTQASCDPILLSGDMNECTTCEFFTCTIGGINIAPGVVVPVIARHAPFCLSVLVYESP
jgi:hypothetical protein